MSTTDPGQPPSGTLLNGSPTDSPVAVVSPRPDRLHKSVEWGLWIGALVVFLFALAMFATIGIANSVSVFRADDSVDIVALIQTAHVSLTLLTGVLSIIAGMAALWIQARTRVGLRAPGNEINLETTSAGIAIILVGALLFHLGLHKELSHAHGNNSVGGEPGKYEHLRESQKNDSHTQEVGQEEQQQDEGSSPAPPDDEAPPSLPDDEGSSSDPPNDEGQPAPEPSDENAPPATE